MSKRYRYSSLSREIDAVCVERVTQHLNFGNRQFTAPSGLSSLDVADVTDPSLSEREFVRVKKRRESFSRKEVDHASSDKNHAKHSYRGVPKHQRTRSFSRSTDSLHSLSSDSTKKDAQLDRGLQGSHSNIKAESSDTIWKMPESRTSKISPYNKHTAVASPKKSVFSKNGSVEKNDVTGLASKAQRRLYHEHHNYHPQKNERDFSSKENSGLDKSKNHADTFATSNHKSTRHEIEEAGSDTLTAGRGGSTSRLAHQEETDSKLHSKGSSDHNSDADPNRVENDDPELKEYIDRKFAKVTVDQIGRTGGIYIPPFKLAELQQQITDPSTVAYQRQSWDALRKSINGLVNKLNISNISSLVRDLFRLNLIRGKGLVARSIIRAQMASPGFTNIYAALLNILNSKLPELGELVVHRVLLQFRRAYRRNDKLVCKACTKFLAHMINQKMVHELLALQLAMLFLEKLTDDSVEICVDFMNEVGQVLNDISPKAFRVIFDRLRAVSQEGTVDQRVQYLIEDFQKTIASKFAAYPGVVPELDLVEEEDKITHDIDLLDSNINGHEMLNVFEPLPQEEFLKNEAEWAKMSADILGEASDAEDKDSKGFSEDDSEDEVDSPRMAETTKIHDLTERDTVALRKTIYLTIMSSANFEECLHKILKLNIKEGQEIEVCTMLIDCNAMERTFQRFFALQAERLCRLKTAYQECFLNCLERQYAAIHHLETNKIRSTAKFFAHLLYTDALPWTCLETFVLTEASTTSASRIFVKILFQELAEQIGLKTLHKKLCDASLAPHLQGIFPTDNPNNIRFSINFFTAIGLGGLTTGLRELLDTLQAGSLSSSSISSDEESGSSSDSASTTTETSSRSDADDASRSCSRSPRPAPRRTRK